MDMSVRKQFEEDLSQLKTELVKMCRLTENMIETAIKALTEQMSCSFGRVTTPIRTLIYPMTSLR